MSYQVEAFLEDVYDENGELQGKSWCVKKCKTLFTAKKLYKRFMNLYGNAVIKERLEMR